MSRTITVRWEYISQYSVYFSFYLKILRNTLTEMFQREANNENLLTSSSMITTSDRFHESNMKKNSRLRIQLSILSFCPTNTWKTLAQKFLRNANKTSSLNRIFIYDNLQSFYEPNMGKGSMLEISLLLFGISTDPSRNYEKHFG